MGAQTNLAILLAVLVAISLAPSVTWLAGACGLLLFRAGRRTVPQLLFLLPLSALISAGMWWSGDVNRAVLMFTKSLASLWAVLVFNDTTPAHEWIAALRAWGFPATFVDVLQLVHRYLVLVGAEAHRMRIAARMRGGFRFTSASGAVGVLFARSWDRSERIQRAMMARGVAGGRL